MTPESSYGRELTSDQTAQLLQVSLTGASRPVDVLVERLSQRDGGAWLQRSLSALLTEQDLQILHDDQPAAEAVATLKQRAKRHLVEASDQQSHLAALMCYCLTVARGLISLNQLLSSRSAEEWAELLADLAGVVPVPWRTLLSEAAVAALRRAQDDSE